MLVVSMVGLLKRSPPHSGNAAGIRGPTVNASRRRVSCAFSYVKANRDLPVDRRTTSNLKELNPARYSDANQPAFCFQLHNVRSKQSRRDGKDVVLTEWLAEHGRVLELFRQSLAAITGQERKRNLAFGQGCRKLVDRIAGKVDVEKRPSQPASISGLALCKLAAGPITWQPTTIRLASRSMDSSASSSTTRIRFPFNADRLVAARVAGRGSRSAVTAAIG